MRKVCSNAIRGREQTKLNGVVEKLILKLFVSEDEILKKKVLTLDLEPQSVRYFNTKVYYLVSLVAVFVDRLNYIWVYMA